MRRSSSSGATRQTASTRVGDRRVFVDRVVLASNRRHPDVSAHQAEGDRNPGRRSHLAKMSSSPTGPPVVRSVPESIVRVSCRERSVISHNPGRSSSHTRKEDAAITNVTRLRGPVALTLSPKGASA